MSTRYTKEFKDRAVRLLTELQKNYSSETKALQGVAKDLGVARESLRRWQEPMWLVRRVPGSQPS